MRRFKSLLKEDTTGRWASNRKRTDYFKAIQKESAATILWVEKTRFQKTESFPCACQSEGKIYTYVEGGDEFNLDLYECFEKLTTQELEENYDIERMEKEAFYKEYSRMENDLLASLGYREEQIRKVSMAEEDRKK